MDPAWKPSNGLPPSHAFSSSERSHRRRQHDDGHSLRSGCQKKGVYAKRTSRRHTRAEDDERCYSQHVWRRSDSGDADHSRRQSQIGHREHGKSSQSRTPRAPHLCRSAPPRAAQRHFAWPDEESPSNSWGASKRGRRHRSASHSEHTGRIQRTSQTIIPSDRQAGAERQTISQISQIQISQTLPCCACVCLWGYSAHQYFFQPGNEVPGLGVEWNGHMHPGPACFRAGHIASGQVRRPQMLQMLSAGSKLGSEELLQFRDI